jgi:putative endonuclease
MTGYMYILTCADGSFYVGSTRDIDTRVAQHNDGEGSLYTQTRLPVALSYFEEYDRIDDAYLREKQVQNWSRAKRIALITGAFAALPALARKVWSSQILPTPPAA